MNNYSKLFTKYTMSWTVEGDYSEKASVGTWAIRNSVFST